MDFAKYGEIERVPLSRIKKISGPSIARNWVMIPPTSPITTRRTSPTALEVFRKQVTLSSRAKEANDMVALLIKASVGARPVPEFNSSLDGDSVVIKRYYNIGFAADTPRQGSGWCR